MARENYVTASEIGEYTYCPRGWWLRYHGLLETTPQMEQGTVFHNRLGLKVRLFHYLRRLAFILMALGIILFILYWFIASQMH